MKRPFLYGALSMFLALLTWLFGDWFVPVIIVLILLIYKSYQLNPKKQKSNLMVIMVGLFCLLYFISVDVSYTQLKKEIGSNQMASGRGVIKTVETTAYNTIYGLKPWWDSNGQHQSFELRMISSGGGAIGDYVTFEGKVKKELSGHNEGAFDLEKYYKASGVVAVVKGKIYIDYHSGKYQLLNNLRRLRQEHSDRLHSILPERHSAIVDDLLLGMKRVSDEDRSMFQESGTVHILAISGLHVALIAGLLFKCMGFIHYDKKNNALIVGVLTVLYCIYTGAHISTIRATIMIIIYFGHMVIYRKYDQYTAVAIAFMLMILVNPLQITSPGFMLSFGAVLSIFFIVPKLFSVWPNCYEWLKPLVFMTGLQIGIGPMLAYYYGELPTYSFMGNLLLLPVVTLIISFSAVAIGVSYLSANLAVLISGSVFWLTNYLLVMVESISSLPGSVIHVPGISLWHYALYYCVVITWLLGRLKSMLLIIVVIIVSLIITTVKPEGSLVVDMMDVGNGDACFVRYDNHVMLIDGGGQVAVDGPNVGEKVLLPYLKSHGIHRIDTVIISHSDFDHVYGIIELMNLVAMDRILLSSVYETNDDDVWINKIKELSEVKGIELIYIEKGDTLKLGDFTVTCLYPFDDTVKEDNNHHSNILHLNLDSFDMLFTGDAYSEDEEALMAQWPVAIGEIEVLKVAHHGSNTSSSEGFIEFISPKISLVSVSRTNIYGHPADDVTHRLATYSDQVFMTKDYGQITITYDEDNIEIETYIK